MTLWMDGKIWVLLVFMALLSKSIMSPDCEIKMIFNNIPYPIFGYNNCIEENSYTQILFANVLDMIVNINL